MRVSFACNDPRNGVFTGRVDAIELESLYRVGSEPWDASFELTHCESLAFTVDDKRGLFRIHRLWFPYLSSRSWFGNWCWDAFVIERRYARILLNVMRDDGGWTCSVGPTQFFRWFNSRRGR